LWLLLLVVVGGGGGGGSIGGVAVNSDVQLHVLHQDGCELMK
jgi:hypothetical protein